MVRPFLAPLSSPRLRLLACIASLSPFSLSAQDLLLRNARLVDPSSRTVELTDLLIRDGRIVGKLSAQAHDATRTIDLSGRWIIPGLVDLHVHSYGNVFPDGTDEDLDPNLTARRMLYCGVTAYLELGTSNLNDIFSARNSQRTGSKDSAIEADIFCAGTPFGPWSLPDAATASATIASYIQRWHPDVIKVIDGNISRGRGINRETLRAVVDTAGKAGLKTVVHIGTWDNARDILQAGAAAITHFDDDETIPDDVVHLWKTTKTVSIPTMAVQSDEENFVQNPSLLDNPLLAAIEAPQSIETYRDTAKYTSKARRTLRWQSEDMANDTRTFGKLAAAGIVILAGSDTCNLGTFQGFSLHREIKLMQEAGFPAWDALAAATTRAADFIHRPSGIHVEEIAELVVLEADPLLDIANTQKIFAVIHHGRLVDRASLIVRPPRG